MKQLLAHGRLPAALATILASALACSSISQVSTSSSTPGAESAAQEGVGEPIQIEREVGPGEFFLEERTVGLDSLSSYTSTLTRSFEGTEAGQARTWNDTTVLMRTTEPALRLMTFSGTAEPAELAVSLLAEANNVTYEIGADGTCTTGENEAAADAGASLVELMEPAAQLHGVFGAEPAGQESVSDVPADYYTFDQRALLSGGISEASGELWMATDGGYLLKYVLTMKADGSYFGEGTEGTLKLAYMLTDINATSAELPAECRVNAPLLADATDIVQVPGWVGYTTATGVPEAVAFYQDQLPGFGWAPSGDPIIDTTGSLLEYTQGDEMLVVTIQPGETGGTLVDLVASAAAE